VALLSARHHMRFPAELLILDLLKHVVPGYLFILPTVVWEVPKKYITLFDERFKNFKMRYILQRCIATLTVFIVLLIPDALTNAVIIASLGAGSFIVFTMPHATVSFKQYSDNFSSIYCENAEQTFTLSPEGIVYFQSFVSKQADRFFRFFSIAC
jgi:uncharacterized Tic20 family protein